MSTPHYGLSGWDDFHRAQEDDELVTMGNEDEDFPVIDDSDATGTPEPAEFAAIDDETDTPADREDDRDNYTFAGDL